MQTAYWFIIAIAAALSSHYVSLTLSLTIFFSNRPQLSYNLETKRLRQQPSESKRTIMSGVGTVDQAGRYCVRFPARVRYSPLLPNHPPIQWVTQTSRMLIWRTDLESINSLPYSADINPYYTKPSSSTLFIKLGSSEDPMAFFFL